MVMNMMHNDDALDELMIMIMHIEDAESDENEDWEVIMMTHNNDDKMMAMNILDVPL